MPSVLEICTSGFQDCNTHSNVDEHPNSKEDQSEWLNAVQIHQCMGDATGSISSEKPGGSDWARIAKNVQ